MPDQSNFSYSAKPEDPYHWIKFGSSAACALTHIRMFGNTERMEKGKAENEFHESISRQGEILEKISNMLFWNQNKIDSCNETLTNKRLSPLVNVSRIKDQLIFNYAVRDRIIGIWNKQLNKMKL